MSDNLGVAFFFIFVGFLFGIFLFYKGFFSLRKKRKIEHTPTSKIRGISLGEVEIYGEAFNPQLEQKDNNSENISPFSKKKCVYYITTIEEERKNKNSTYWQVIHLDKFIRPFYVKDDTGKIIVDPHGAKFDIPLAFEEISGFGRDPSNDVRAYLDKNEIKFEGLFGMNKKLKYTERIIAEGDKVYVFGDTVPSGKMSSVGNENILINKKNKRSLFLISTSPEKDVLKLFGRRVLFEIYGGAALSILCLAIILKVFG